jgi:hypothetical protein
MLRCLALEEGDPLLDRGGWIDRAQVPREQSAVAGSQRTGTQA